LGEYETSLFDIEHHCKKTHQTDANVYVPKHDCCKKMMACHKKQDDNDCTKKNKKFFKADLKYLETDKVKLPEYHTAAVLPITLKYHFLSYTSDIQRLSSEIHNRPPPQLFGRKLLNFIQMYRC
jgi:hypothetical protein